MTVVVFDVSINNDLVVRTLNSPVVSNGRVRAVAIASVFNFRYCLCSRNLEINSGLQANHQRSHTINACVQLLKLCPLSVKVLLSFLINRR